MPRLQCNQKQEKRHQHTERESKNASKLFRMEWIEEMGVNEEVREQRKKRSDSATAAVPETESAAPEPTENPIEPKANPRRRLLMKSVSWTAFVSGQRKEKRSIPDDESRMQVEDKTETVMGKVQRCLQYRTPGGELLRSQNKQQSPRKWKSDEDRECRTN